MKKQVVIREFDEELWRKFRAKVVEKGVTTPKALEEAITFWLEKK